MTISLVTKANKNILTLYYTINTFKFHHQNKNLDFNPSSFSSSILQTNLIFLKPHLFFLPPKYKIFKNKKLYFNLPLLSFLQFYKQISNSSIHICSYISQTTQNFQKKNKNQTKQLRVIIKIEIQIRRSISRSSPEDQLYI